MSDSLWSHGLQHDRLPCPSLSPKVCSDSCPLSQWYHPTIASFATLFSFCFQSFPASRSFPMTLLFASGSQSIGAFSRGGIRSVLGVHWKDWCWSWNSNTLATWCKELTYLKRHWCWERLRDGGEGDNRGWDGWMASPTQWTWVWVDSSSWWWTGRPGALQFMGLQRVGHDWATELELEAVCQNKCKLNYWLSD